MYKVWREYEYSQQQDDEPTHIYPYLLIYYCCLLYLLSVPLRSISYVWYDTCNIPPTDGRKHLHPTAYLCTQRAPSLWCPHVCLSAMPPPIIPLIYIYICTPPMILIPQVDVITTTSVSLENGPNAIGPCNRLRPIIFPMVFYTTISMVFYTM